MLQAQQPLAAARRRDVAPLRLEDGRKDNKRIVSGLVAAAAAAAVAMTPLAALAVSGGGGESDLYKSAKKCLFFRQRFNCDELMKGFVGFWERCDSSIQLNNPHKL